MKKNVLILTVFMVGGIVFGVEPKTNNETNSNSNSKRVEEKEIYPGI